MSEHDLKLLQGTLDVLVLKALTAGSKHGYAVAEWIRTITDETLHIEDGALYNALHRMEKRQWLESRWGLSENNRRAKFYQLTTAGQQQLDDGTSAWNAYADAVSKVLTSEGGGR